MFQNKILVRHEDGKDEGEIYIENIDDINGDDFDLPPASPFYLNFATEENRTETAQQLAKEFLRHANNPKFLTAGKKFQKEVLVAPVTQYITYALTPIRIDERIMDQLNIVIHNTAMILLDAADVALSISDAFSRGEDIFKNPAPKYTNLDDFDDPPIDTKLFGKDNEKDVSGIPEIPPGEHCVKMNHVIEALGYLTIDDMMQLNLNEDEITLILRLYKRFA